MDKKRLLLLFGFGALASQVFGSNKKSNSTTTVGEDIDFRSLGSSVPRSTRNNNPGNVKNPGGNGWNGTVGYDEIGHAIFQNYIFGTRAMILDVLAKIKRGENTINKFLPIYCPKSDKCPIEKYIDYVETNSGINRNKVLTKTNTNELFDILQAMTNYEAGFKNGAPLTKFNRAFFDAAFAMISGIREI